ncbi:MAG: efflux RND transporter periplasmic adaptor subunit [Bacteroidales bacterium]|jgi:RND family efflux transporter MFP subunit|nr:efflux RND transporter periplasmic adaptor subunit [Bacteroidales bacterium]
MKVYQKIVFAITALFLFAACSDKKETQTQEKIIPVKIMTVETLHNAISVQNYVGTVEESVAVSLSFSLMGTVEQVFVSEGQKVTKGQLLATLNTATAENSYKASLAKQQQAQDAYNRLKHVHDNGSLPDIKFVEVETGLQQAKSMAAVSKKNLDDCRMYAPRDGVIATRNIEAGSSVNPTSTAFKLVSIDKIFVKIPIPENEIGNIRKGQMASVTVPALNNTVFTGKVEMKGVSANAISHTYEAKIGIENPKKTLLPGMVCKVEIYDSTSLQTAQIVVPNRVIQISADGKRYVWLVKNNTAKRRFVETGNLTNNGIIVTEGLTTGDKVITEGFLKISEGTKISITN